jgi:hypothetical protein
MGNETKTQLKNITKITLTKQLTNMLMESKNNMIKKTINDIGDNISDIEEEIKNKLLLIPTVVKEMMENAEHKAEIIAINEMK